MSKQKRNKEPQRRPQGAGASRAPGAARPAQRSQTRPPRAVPFDRQTEPAVFAGASSRQSVPGGSRSGQSAAARRTQTAYPRSAASGRQPQKGRQSQREQQLRAQQRQRQTRSAPVRTSKPPRRLTQSEMRRRRRRRNFLLALLTLILIGVGVALSVTVLFQVKSFRVENLDKSTPPNTGIYTQEAILSTLDVKVGDNLFSFSAAEKEKQMLVALPYLETVQIRRSLPSTLVIRVAPATETWCVQTDGGWATLSAGLSVMKVDTVQPDLPQLRGIQVGQLLPGYQLASQDEEQMDQLSQLLDVMDQYDMKNEATLVDLSNPNEVYFVYQGRAKVLLGTLNNLDYKMKFAAWILKNEDGKGVESGESGRLDVSHQMSDGTLQPVWTPGDIEELTRPSETAQQTPAPDTSAQPQTSQAPEGENGAQATASPQPGQGAEATPTPPAEGQPTATPTPPAEEQPTATPTPPAEEQPTPIPTAVP